MGTGGGPVRRWRFPRRYGIIFWCPLIIDALLGSAEGQTAGAPLVALLTALPFGVSAVAIFLNSSHSKATGEPSRLPSRLPSPLPHLPAVSADTPHLQSPLLLTLCTRAQCMCCT